MPATKDNARSLRYVARQPILTSGESVFGYELLFRDGVADYFSSPDSDAASRSTLDASLLLGLDVLCDGRYAFINCTRDLLLNDYLTLLPSDRVVAEILETVPADEEVIAACRRLKQAGYMIALDDFVPGDPREPLTRLADIIKVDVRRSSLADSTAIFRQSGERCRLLAEKVETREEFVATRKAGFTYFQGYFFRKPELLRAREIPANRANYLHLLKVTSRAELDPRELEDAIKGEASLCYRLLRYLNSPVFGFPAEIRSIRHALVMLGEREVRRWLRLATTLVASQSGPSDLVLSALVRARFCELLALGMRHGNSDLFLVGLLSLMDAILGMPMAMVLEGIALDRATRAVLLGQSSPLTPIYDLMLAQENAQWEKVEQLSSELRLRGGLVAECHWKAMQWARQMTGGPHLNP
ncbi:MAG TPA: HDOD domain-containing protein [Terriglobales bacterium]|jgi:EAL and modified HD-GYP domain-containing signal transduction protein|nr:HDOD domain-containing protein [Terriglobales bacterium]